jgi:hypothetical protein
MSSNMIQFISLKKFNLGSQFKKKQCVQISEFPKYVEEDL